MKTANIKKIKENIKKIHNQIKPLLLNKAKMFFSIKKKKKEFGSL